VADELIALLVVHLKQMAAHLLPAQKTNNVRFVGTLELDLRA
jgi:hypothetical protein